MLWVLERTELAGVDHFTDQEKVWMARALELAAVHRHSVHPNPMVGAVLVRDGKVIGEGAHERFGGNHAEVNAILDAQSQGESTQGATCFVTLEPCHHTGKTPPCTEALVSAGITQVVMAMRDPNPKVNGSGRERLLGAGLTVREGLLNEEVNKLIRGFVSVQKFGLPWVTLKTAQSLDGKMAGMGGKSAWITSSKAREEVMAQRFAHDAVFCGTGTLLTDNPRLTVRPSKGTQPIRIALDLRGRLNEVPAYVLEDPATAWVVTSASGQAVHQKIQELGGRIISVPAELDLKGVLGVLAEAGLNSIFVEGGPHLAGAMLSQNLVDEWLCFVAPILLGGAEDFSISNNIPPRSIGDPIRFKQGVIKSFVREDSLGEDLLWTLQKAD